MSYVTAIKELLGNDLKSLIHQITGFTDVSQEFLKIEEKSWSTILNRNYVSVTDEDVKKTLYGFVEKFIFHGFHIKAQNLKLLIDIYSNLRFFQNTTNVVLQWSLIDLLIKLSYKPTHATNDDPQLDVNKFKQKIAVQEDFDWGTYLKEGFENFILPESEDEEWSQDSDDDATLDNEEKVSLHLDLSLIHPAPSEIQQQKDQILDTLRKEEKLKINLEDITQKPYWLDPDFREIPPSKSLHANWCFRWEELMKKNEGEIEYTRVYSEYKIMREIINLFFNPPDDDQRTLLVEKTNKGYCSIERVSISSLSPPMFAGIIENRVCEHLMRIKGLNDFIYNMSKLPDNVPFTYYAYSIALGRIIGEFNSKLLEMENIIRAQNKTYTMLKLFYDITPWLRHIQYVYSIHQKAINKDYKCEENWKSALKLLSVLYNEIDNYDNTRKRTAFGLFLHSFTTYLRIIDRLLNNTTPVDCKNEFIIYRSQNQLHGIEMRDYSTYLKEINGDCVIWKTFFDICIRALTSVHFLTTLNKTTTFAVRPSVYDLFYKGLMEDLKNLLLQLHPDMKTSDVKVPELPECMFPFKGQDLHLFKILRNKMSIIPLIKHKSYYRMEKIFDIYRIPAKPTPRETPLDCFLKDLTQTDIKLIPVNDFIKKHLFGAVECNLETKGTISSIILQEFNLMDHLQYIWKVFFIRVPTMISAILNGLSEKLLTTRKLSICLRKCLVDHIPANIITKFSITILDIPSSVMSNSILDKIEYLTLQYKVDTQLRLIITEEILSNYGQLFKFLLQIKYSYKILQTLRFGEFDDSTEIARRLFSLRLWLLHTISAFNTYFSNLNEDEFLEKMKNVCEETRDLHAIQHAHIDCIKQCKIHCFFNSSILQKLLSRLFKSTETLLQLWFLEKKHQLTITKIENLEKEYLDIMKSILLQIEINFMGRVYYRFNKNFKLLHDEIVYNIPAAWD